MTVLEATVQLVDSPPCRALLVAGYPDAPPRPTTSPRCSAHRPLGLEGVDELLIEDMTMNGMHSDDLSLLPDGRRLASGRVRRRHARRRPTTRRARCSAISNGRAERLRGIRIYDDQESEQHVWEVREAGLGATAFVPGRPDTHEGWEDSAVPPERLGEYLRELRS